MFVATPQGRIGVGTATPINSIDVTVDEASTSLANYAGALFTTYTNSGFAANGFVARGARGTITAPLATQANDQLFGIGARGFDGTAFSPWSKAFLNFKSSENWTPTAQGTYFAFETTATGTVNRSEKMRVTGEGNVGIGATAPTQKLEVNGGVRINTVAAKPGCDSTARGTFWMTQKGTGVMDTLEVCIKDAAETYIWKAVW